MSATTLDARRPAGILVIVLGSLLTAGLVLLGGSEISPKLWMVFFALLAVFPAGWLLSRQGILSLDLVDQVVWAVLLAHTVFVARLKTTGGLVEGQALTSEIVIQVLIWGACLVYASARLLGNLARLKTLCGRNAKYMTLFAVAAISSTSYSISPMTTLAWSIKLGTILLVGSLLFDPKDPIRSCSRFLQATYAALVMMLAQYVILGLTSPEAAIEISGVSSFPRLGGYLFPPTQLSSVAGLVALIALTDLLTTGRKTASWIVLAGSLGLMVGSFGRAGILAAGVAMCLPLVRMKRTKLAVGLSLIVCMAFLYAPNLVDISWDLVTRGQRPQELASLTGRLPLWDMAMNRIMERPLLGWGYVSGGRVVLAMPFYGWIPSDAHNAYIETVLALGLLGGVIMFVCLAKSFLSATVALVATWRETPPTEAALITLKVLSLLVCLLVYGFFEGSFSGVPRVHTALLCGLVFCTDQLRRHSPR